VKIPYKQRLESPSSRVRAGGQLAPAKRGQYETRRLAAKIYTDFHGVPEKSVARKTEFPQCIFFMSWPHAQRGLRTLVASNESFTTSISQQHLEFTQRYLSFLFMAMI
jgi:hypothetical protein